MKYKISKLLNIFLVIIMLFSHFSGVFASDYVENNSQNVFNSNVSAKDIVNDSKSDIDSNMDDQIREDSNEETNQDLIQEQIKLSEADKELIKKYRLIISNKDKVNDDSPNGRNSDELDNEDDLADRQNKENHYDLDIDKSDNRINYTELTASAIEDKKGYFELSLESQNNKVIKSLSLYATKNIEIVKELFTQTQERRIEEILNEIDSYIKDNQCDLSNNKDAFEKIQSLLGELRNIKAYYSLEDEHLTIKNESVEENKNNKLILENNSLDNSKIKFIIRVKDNMDLEEEDLLKLVVEGENEEDKYSLRCTKEIDEDIRYIPALYSNSFYTNYNSENIGLRTNGKNRWQIVSQIYKGNSQRDKKGFKAFENYEDVWIQKNVVPTDVENEFKIYLSISKRVGWDSLLQEADFIITTSNKYHRNDIGDIITSIKGRHGKVNANPNNGGRTYHATVYFERNNRKIATRKMKFYGEVPNCNNATGFVSVNGLVFLTSKSVNLQGNDLSFTINLDALEQAGVYYLAPPAQLEYVDDKLGDYLIYDGQEYADGSVAYDKENKLIKWNIKENPNVKITHQQSPITGYYYNVAQLVYKVKLDVKKPGFHPCANNMERSTSDGGAYFTSEYAKLFYKRTWDDKDTSTYHQADFPKPSIRGLLYDLKIKKVDKNNRILLGDRRAKFKIIDKKNNEITRVSEIDDDGTMTLRDMPWGTYEIEEVITPYKFPYDYKSNGPNTVNLSYTDNVRDLIQSDKSGNMIYRGNGGGILNIKNETKTGNIEIEKEVLTNLIGEEKNELVNKEFSVEMTLRKKDLNGDDRTISGEFECEFPNGNSTITFDSDGKASFKIKNGQRVLIKNLPAEARLDIKEIDLDRKFTVEYSKQTINVEEDKTITSTIKNKYFISNFDIIKKNSKTGEFLPGAEFTIYNSDDNWNKNSEVFRAKSARNGKVEVRSIKPGKYILVETKVPDGFISENAFWKIQVDGQGKTTITNEKGIDLAKKIVKGIDIYIIGNVPGVELPRTGARGITLIKVIGGSLILVAGFVLIRKKRNV